MVENIKKYIDNLQIRFIAQKIKEKFNPQRVILFGSYAYGIPKRSSDLDILIIKDTELRYPKQASQIRLYLDETVGVNFPMDIIVRSPKFIEERLKKGDFFIKTVLEKGIEL